MTKLLTPMLLLLLVLVGAGASFAPSLEPEQVQLYQKLGVDEAYLEQRGWIVDKIKNVIGSIGARFKVFRNWIQKKFQHLLELSKPHVEVMKEMALAFIKEMTHHAIEAVLQAGYEFFKERRLEIGEQLWRVVEALYRKFLEGKLRPLQRAVEVHDFSVQEFDRLALDGCSAQYLLTEGFFLQSIKNVIGGIKDLFNPFRNWISAQMKNMWNAVQPHVETMREMALLFVKEMAKAAIEAVIKAGYEFFKERQNELGETVWRLVEAVYRKFLEGKLQYLQ